MFSTNLVVPEATYSQTGETKIYEDRGDSGQAVLRHFCGSCGSPILSRAAVIPGMALVKAGTLDDLAGISPVVEVYCDHAVAWVQPIPGARRFAQSSS
jgi:hypothetical protein